MGIPFSLLGKLGVPGVQSLSTDQIFNNYFSNGSIKDFKEFHVAFLNACNDLNAIMPGKHYNPPSRDKILKFYDEWKGLGDKERRQKFIQFMHDNITEYKVSNDMVMMAGLVAPPAAMVLKRTGENIPQLKKFRLNIIPDIVFVPSCTLLAVLGLKVVQMKTSGKSSGIP